MAALGWYAADSGGLPAEAPPSDWSGTAGLNTAWSSLRGGVIGAASGPVTWAVKWVGQSVDSDPPDPPQFITVATSGDAVTITINGLHDGWRPWISGVLTIEASDANGPLDGALELAYGGGMGVYNDAAWRVVGSTPPTTPDFWTGFVSSYEVP